MNRSPFVAAAIGLVLAALLATGGYAARSGETAGRKPAVPTFADVAPIFNSKCSGCHMAGGIAPFSVTDPTQARNHAALIKIMTRTGAMPPWPPGTDSKPFIGQGARLLTAQEKAVIARWVDGGARIGPRIPAQPRPATAKGLVLAPSVAYMPNAEVGLDDYHCTLLDPKLSEGEMVTAAHVLPGRPDIVHHVILYEMSGPFAAEARAKNRASGGQGWTCFGGPGVGVDSLDHGRWLGAWVPGKTNDAFPAGTGMSLPKGAVIVAQVHYNLARPARPDRTRIALEFAPPGAKVKPLETKLFLAPIEVPCPAGVKNPLCSRDRAIGDLVTKYGFDSAAMVGGLLQFCGKTLAAATGAVTSCDRRLAHATTIYAVAGHMHVRGVEIRVELNPGRPGATLLHIPAWSFHWQDVYTLKQPIRAPAGSVVRVTCRYDNSRAKQPVIGGKAVQPRYLLWGEGTTDEMCLGVLQTGVTPGR